MVLNNNKQDLFFDFISKLQDSICNSCEEIEKLYLSKIGSVDFDIKPVKDLQFTKKRWNREDNTVSDGGFGNMAVMRGNVFEKMGVNISKVHGVLDEKFAKEIPGALENDNKFWAAGISLVSHMRSPLIPAVHMNVRLLFTSKSWFGGGIDLTPYQKEDKSYYDYFHNSLKDVCDIYDKDCYDKFSSTCDKYFYLPHRKEPRGIGGIFFDYLNSDNWENDFTFAKNIANSFEAIYLNIVKKKLFDKWTMEQKKEQLLRRGRYVEFNLLYDRGTKFGLQTNGNIDAIFMSLPQKFIGKINYK